MTVCGEKEDGENENDGWIKVKGRDKPKTFLIPKLKPTVINSFAILSQPNDPTIYYMSTTTTATNNDKTTPEDPKEHRQKRKMAQRRHIKLTL